MNKSIGRIIMAALAVFSASSTAGTRYFVNTGISKPFSPAVFKDQWRSGYNLGAGIGFQLTPKFEIEGEFLLHQMQLDDNAYLRRVTLSDDLYSAVSGGTVSIMELSANMKYMVPSAKNNQVTPYLLVAVGIADKIISAKEVTTEDKSFTEPRETSLAPSAGLGMGFEIIMAKNTSLVIEGGFHFLFAQETTIYFPLKFGIVLH